jgi:hypothetical protein
MIRLLRLFSRHQTTERTHDIVLRMVDREILAADYAADLRRARKEHGTARRAWSDLRDATNEALRRGE